MSTAEPRRRPQPPRALLEFLGSAPLSRALTLAIIGTGLATHAIRALIGWPGLIAVVSGLVVLAVASLATRARVLDWNGLLPISILIFVGWCVASVLWSDYTAITVFRVLYLLVFAFLGVYVAVTRDTIQIVRSVGDVMRVLLGLSLGLEVLAGILIDTPIGFLGIQGDLARLGPIQGVFGSRNMLGFVSLIALITFMVEWRTRSVRRPVAVASIALGGVSLLLTGSPTSLLAAAVVALATAALYGLRKATPQARWGVQITILVLGVVGLIVGFVLRQRILNVLDARSEFDVRLDLWRIVLRYQSEDSLLGWGWTGTWSNRTPYFWINLAADRVHSSALSAWVDVFFQVGVIGALAFLALVGLAGVRAWLLASARRSVVYVWPALVLVAIVITSFAESFALVEGGWMLLVICAVKAARDMSWRDALAPGAGAGAAGPALPRQG